MSNGASKQIIQTGGGGGGGTVTNVSSTSADLTVANPTSTPALTVVSAPKLTTARNINGVAFDGTANITVADSTKQPVDAGLTSISALTGAGYVKATATDTFSQVTTIPVTDISGTTADFNVANTDGDFLTVASALTTGSVPFVGPTGLILQDNANLFFDDTNNRLGVGTNTPTATIHGIITDAATTAISIPLKLEHNLSSGTAGTNIGVGLEMYAPTDTNPSRLGFSLSTKWRVATDGTRQSYIEATGVSAGTSTKIFQWNRAAPSFELLGNDPLTSVLSANSVAGVINTNTTVGNTCVLSLNSENTAKTAFVASQNNNLILGTGNGSRVAMTLLNAGQIGIGTVTSPTSLFHLQAGTATANTAPLKFNSGVNLTTIENGAVEYDGTHLYVSIGGVRYQLDQQAVSIPSTAISDFASASRAQTEAELVAGTNITITPSGTGATRQLTIASTGGGGTMTVQDEGSTTSTTVTTLNFTGAGVTASGAGATATINIGGGGGNSTKGIAEVNFGTITQESDIATVTVIDASISATSYPSVTMYGLATADHDPDDYMAEGLTAYITNIINGVSFDIAVTAPNLTWGKYKVTYLY